MALLGVLSGCSSDTNAIIQSLKYVYDRNAGVTSAVLNPKFRYLRVTVDGRIVLLALGYVDSAPDGPVEVWYSAEREVIRLQNGRVVGVVGLTPEWRDVELHGAPSWLQLMNSDHSLKWTRIRDVMPGYLSRIVDNMASRSISTVRTTALVGVLPRELKWFEDVREPDTTVGALALFSTKFDKDQSLPPARYGISDSDGNATVVYGEQCLSVSFCFTWQRWPQELPGKSEQSKSAR